MAKWLGRASLVGIVAALALGVGVLTAGPAVAQTQAPGSPMQRFLQLLAQNLGIAEDQLNNAVKTTQLQLVDEAVAAGRLTPEQAERARQRIEQGHFFGPGLFGHHGPAGRGKGPAALHGSHGAGLQAVAELLGLSSEQLRAELRERTLAEVGQVHGKSREEVGQAYLNGVRAALDRAVSEGRLTREKADAALQSIQSRLDQILDQRHPAAGGRRSGPGIERIGAGGLATVAQVLGISPQQLRDELPGKTIAEVAQAHGKSREEVSAALLQAARDKLDRAVADGRLTRERADEMLARAQEQINRLLDRRWPERRQP